MPTLPKQPNGDSDQMDLDIYDREEPILEGVNLDLRSYISHFQSLCCQHAAAGLYELNCLHYKKAAKLFLVAIFEHSKEECPETAVIRNLSNMMGAIEGPRDASSSAGPSEKKVLPPVNIGVYGSLCTLATYSRQELASDFVNPASFKQFAELEHQLREAISRFHESKYAPCLSILQEIKSTLLQDMYIAPHIERLYRMIRNKALVQYLEPYSTASLLKMSEAFSSTVTELEEEITTLICDGHIKARIDSHNKILYSKKLDPRTLTFERAIKMGKQWQLKTRAQIARLTILKAGLVVNSAPILPTKILRDSIARAHVV